MNIPKGITFGNKVLTIPGYARDFMHSAKVDSPKKIQSYQWINRGDPIAEFKIAGSYEDSFLSKLITSKVRSAVVRSPASGLLLASTLPHESYESMEKWNSLENPPMGAFALLLPDDEPNFESGKYMYESMCELAYDMRHYYFKKSRYWSMEAFTPEFLDRLIELQINAKPKIFDALTNWNDHLNEARINQPELRPFIKHLI